MWGLKTLGLFNRPAVVWRWWKWGNKMKECGENVVTTFERGMVGVTLNPLGFGEVSHA
jgi:hypothetical protein